MPIHYSESIRDFMVRVSFTELLTEKGNDGKAFELFAVTLYGKPKLFGCGMTGQKTGAEIKALTLYLRRTKEAKDDRIRTLEGLSPLPVSRPVHSTALPPLRKLTF